MDLNAHNLCQSGASGNVNDIRAVHTKAVDSSRVFGVWNHRIFTLNTKRQYCAIIKAYANKSILNQSFLVYFINISSIELDQALVQKWSQNGNLKID